MIILIDAYNILKQLFEGEMITEQQRRAFIKQISLYQRKRKHKKILVVFDGGMVQWPSREKIRGTSVIYTGVQQSADDYIKSFVSAHKDKAENMVVVSSDRELCSWVDDYGVATVDALEFYRLMVQALKPSTKIVKPQKAIKLTAQVIPELDRLMQEAAENITNCKPEDDNRQFCDLKPSQKLSQKNRVLLKKIKKL